MFKKLQETPLIKLDTQKENICLMRNSCGVLSAIHEQSPDINQGVERASLEDQGAGRPRDDVWLCDE